MEIAKRKIRVCVSYGFNIGQFLDDAMDNCHKEYGRHRYFIYEIKSNIWNSEVKQIVYDLLVEADTEKDIDVFSEFCKWTQKEEGNLNNFWVLDYNKK